MNKEQEIKKFLSQPPVVGEKVSIRGLNHNNPNGFDTTLSILEVKEDYTIVVSKYGTERIEIKPEDYKRSTRHIGADPFPKKPWNARLRIVNFTLYSILHQVGWENDREYGEYTTNSGKKVIVQPINWNPIVVDDNGKEVVYQRDFCWSLRDKQLLIESIYNNIDIGKMVVRRREFRYAIERAGEGKESAFLDIVDGKQRLNALLGFVNGEFEDLHGNKWDDLSEYAQHKFLDFQSIAYGELGEEASDQDVKDVFLGVNFAGVPMSQEHIDFVKSISI